MQRLYYRFADFLSHHLRTDIHFFISGGFWLTAMQIVILVGGLITSVVLTNLLDPSTYGVYKYLISLGVLLSTFSFSGITQSIQQSTIKGYLGFFPFAMRKSFIFSLGITIGALLIGSYYWFEGNTVLAIGCGISAILVPLTTVYQNIIFFLFGQKRFKTVTIFQGFDTLISTVILIGVLLITKSILILVFVYLLLQFLGNLLAYLLYRPHDPKTIPEEVIKKYYSYAWHTTLRNIIFNIAFRLDTVIVFTHLGATDLAIYAIANLIPDQVKSSFGNLSSLLLLRYAKHDDLSVVRKTVLRRSIQLLSLLMVVTIAYILLAPYLYHVLFPKYNSSIFYTQIAALAFPSFLALIPISALQAQLKEKELHTINLINSVCLLGTIIVLTYTYGLIGALFSRIVYRYLSLFLSYYYLFKSENKKMSVK